MRALVGLVLVLAAGAGAWWAVQSVTGHDTFAVPIAFGFTDAETIEMQAVASMGMTVTEPPRVEPVTGKVLWEEWIEEHFEVRDAGGNRVKLALRSSSDMIPKHKIVGTPEGYLTGRLQKGAAYTFDYIPKRLESKRYRYAFTAPDAEWEVERISFKAG